MTPDPLPPDPLHRTFEVPRPTPGRTVWYQTDGRNYDYFLPALVNITVDNLAEAAVAAGVMPGLSSPSHVHLFVPGGAQPYYEYDVPFSASGRPRSWRYPDISYDVIEVPSETPQ